MVGSKPPSHRIVRRRPRLPPTSNTRSSSLPIWPVAAPSIFCCPTATAALPARSFSWLCGWAPNSVWLAQFKDCARELGGPDQNELTYHDAFAGVNGVACSIDVQLRPRTRPALSNVILRPNCPPRRLADDGRNWSDHRMDRPARSPNRGSRLQEAQPGQPEITTHESALERRNSCGRAYSLGDPSRRQLVPGREKLGPGPATAASF